MFRINIMTNPNTMPSVVAMTKTTRTARRAPSEFPAPSSFETRVLYILQKPNKKASVGRQNQTMWEPGR